MFMIACLILICKGVFNMNELTLREAFDLFIFDRQTFCLDKTIENYNNTIRYFCDYMEESRQCPADQIPLSSITSLDLKKYVVWLRSRPRNFNHPFKESGGKLSKRSVRNYTVDLKTFLNYLYKDGYMENIGAGLTVIKAEKKVVIPLSAPEVKMINSLFRVRTALGCRNYCIIHLMLDAGLRSNEVCTLQIQDLNFDSRYIRVFGKGSKERVVPMAANLQEYLCRYIRLYRPQTDSTYLFAGINHEPLTDSAVKSLFVRIRKRSGIERIKPHLLRHTFATCYILDGGSVEMLRILLGHESISTTQIYMHLAAVYEYQEEPYQLDPVFFTPRRPGKRRL